MRPPAVGHCDEEENVGVISEQRDQRKLLTCDDCCANRIGNSSPKMTATHKRTESADNSTVGNVSREQCHSTSSSSSGGSRIVNCNKMSRRRNFSDSMEMRLRRIGAQTRHFITNPNLVIVVIIVVLSNCPSAVRAKPVRSRSGISGAGVISPNIISGSPGQFLEGGRQQQRQQKQQTEMSAHEDAVNTMRRAIAEIAVDLDAFTHAIQNTDAATFDKQWRNTLENQEYQWLDRNKNVDDIDSENYPEELIDLYLHFEKIAAGIRMIKEALDEDHVQEPNHKVTSDAHSTASFNSEQVLSILTRYYNELRTRGVELKETPLPIKDSEVPQRDAYVTGGFMQHYYILRQLLRHLRYTQEALQRVKENEVGAAAGEN